MSYTGTFDPQLIRRFGNYSYRSVAEGRELQPDARGSNGVQIAVGVALLCASLALNLTGTVELPPAIALGVMGTLIALPAVAAATDRSRTLINGDSIAFGEPRAHPDVRWSTRDVLAVELHRPSRKVPPALRPRRPPEPWRVRLRNGRGEHFPPVFALLGEDDARSLAAELAARLDAPVEER